MKWFRSNIKHGSRLALLALAIQFVLSFGHFHGIAAHAAPAIPQAASSSMASAKTLAAEGVASQDAAQTAAVDAVKPRPASNPDHDGQPADLCAICAVMALAGTVLFTEPPVLLLPEAYHFLYLTTDAEFNHLESRRVVFQPRAPPAS